MTSPNIVFILIDDMGWRDLACYGSDFYETPNLDRLAREGMRFTDAYASCPVCSPTRASLLTGKYPARLGVTDYIDWSGHWHPCRGRLVDVPYLKQLPLEEFNVARALKEGGYQTWHVGKWHLGQSDFYPDKQGFDVNIGGWEIGCPVSGYFSPWKIPTLPDGEPGEYLTDHLTDEALKLIANRDSERPFFLNLWHYTVHTPIQAPAELVQKYKDKAARLGRDKMPVLEEGESFPTEYKRTQRVQRRVIQSDPVYAAMVENLDTNIGRLLAVLPENTLVIFTSDNGGLSTAEGSPTSNRPLAKGKGWMYEGGTREPLIVRWPGMIDPGSVCTAPVTSPDFYPTLLDAAGLPPRPDQHVDGTSFLQALRGKPDFARGPLFWHYPHYGNQGGTPGSSIRMGDWKLIEFFETGTLELYNLREDLGEKRNLAAEQPERVRNLQERLAAWQREIEAKIPEPNPEWVERGPEGEGTLAQGSEKTRWAGHWIWLDDASQARNAYGYFRRGFHVSQDGVIRIDITADSFYELHVDGIRIGRGPARSHLNYYGFDRHEIRLSAGDHVAAVLVHHIGVQNATVMTGRPGLLVDILADNTAIGSDDAWRCLPAAAWRSDLPCLMSHFGFWEECDLALVPPGWTSAGFDDSAWARACIVGRLPCPPWTRLIEPDIPPPRQAPVAVREITGSGSWTPRLVQEDDQAKRNVVAGGWLAGAPTTDIPSKQAAVRIRTSAKPAASLPLSFTSGEQSEGGWCTLDFGRPVSGYPHLLIEATEAGVVVDVSYDDILGTNGAVNPERSYARLTDRFRLAKGVNRIQPVHPRGFRYVTVDVSGPGTATVRQADALEETYPFSRPAEFRSSDPVLGTFAARGAETVRICTTDAFTDCASRERVQWMEDLYQHAHVAAYAFGDVKMMRRALFQGAQNALPDGRINGFMPSERTGCAFASSSLMWLRLLAEYRLFAGDDESCRRLVPVAKRLLELLASLSDASGLISRWPGGQFWDWSPVEGQGCLLLTNAFYIWALSRLAEDPLFARELGSGLGHRAARLRASAHARFWDPARLLYRDADPPKDKSPIYSQHGNALAVLAGICPEAERAPLLRRVIDPARLGPVPVGEHSLNDQNRPDPDQLVPVGTLWFGHFVCQALFEAGLDREALDQMRLLWGAYPDSPTFPETRIQKGNTTQCHGWAGGPAWLLPAYVLGVRPVAAGWSHVVVAPQPGGLASASGTVPTPRGPVAVSWRLGAGGKIELDVKAPEGVRVVRQDDLLIRP
jgi:arylsulfatase A-like enzyme